MKKNKNNTKYIIISIIAIIFLLVLLFSFTLKEDRQLNKFESFIKDTTITVQKVISYPFKYVFKEIDKYHDLINIRKKYQKLLPEISRIDSLKAENIELRKQLEAMQKELSIENTLNEYSYLNATVINRNVATWYNTITVDKGKYNGVEPNMVVVNNEGLIGKVVSTTTFTSDIRLITTKETNNKISITISNGSNKVNGLIKNYNYNNKLLEVEGISNTKTIHIGDYVYTSGLGEIFPSGILIGKVKEISTDEYDLAKIINVEPIANFNDINYVAILKRKEFNK